MKFVKGLLTVLVLIAVGGVGTYAGILFKFGEAQALDNYAYPNLMLKVGKELYKRIME